LVFISHWYREGHRGELFLKHSVYAQKKYENWLRVNKVIAMKTAAVLAHPVYIEQHCEQQHCVGL